MFGSVARPDRRSLFATLSFLFAVGIAASIVMANAERTGAIGRATKDAREQADALATHLTARQLTKPATGTRYRRLATTVRKAVGAGSPIDRVTIWSSNGRIVFSPLQALVGTAPPEMQPLIANLSGSPSRSQIQDDVLQTFVPVAKKGGGPIAVAEMDRSFGPVAAQVNGIWATARTALTLALAGSLLLLVVTFLPALGRGRSRKGSTADGDQAPAPAGEAPSEGPPRRFKLLRRTMEKAEGTGPAYMQPGFRQVEEARQAAEERARSTEAGFQSLQMQFERAVDQVKTLENTVQSQESLRQQLHEAEKRARDAETRIKELEAEIDKMAFGAGSAQRVR